MGLFSGTRKVYVSSSIYNMAGDEIDRPNYLKSNIFAATMNPYNAYLGETLVRNYLTGPGIMQRSFHNWAVNADIAGLPTLVVSEAVSIEQSVVEPFVPIPGTPANLENVVQSAELVDGDYVYWAEKWLFENNPAELTLGWFSDYDATSHEITIQYGGGGTVVIPATNYDKDKKFVIARYYQVVPASVEALVVGTKVLDALTEPSTTGFSLTSTTNTGSVDYSVDQNIEVNKVYSNGDPDVFTTTPETNIIAFNTVLEEWNKNEYLGQTGAAEETSDLESWFYKWERRSIYTDAIGVVESVVVNDLGGGVTETVTTTRTGEFLEPIYDHQLDTQETINSKIDGSNGIWIYEIGTGNATLDALVGDTLSDPEPQYYPFIPLRLNNKSITEPEFAALYAESKKAYKRATGGPLKGKSLDAILTEIEDNPDIGDIDYAYIQWGVSVNVIDPACRRYMYEWFKKLIDYQSTSAATMTSYTSVVNTYTTMKSNLSDWQAAQTNDLDPLFGTVRPGEPIIVDPDSAMVRLVSDHPQLTGFDNRFTWVNITETFHSGLGKVGALPGDIWWETGANLAWDISSGFANSSVDTQYDSSRALDEMILIKQTGVNTYSKITVWGMVHENYIYEGKAVRTTLKEGVNDVAESIFIVPLHAPSVKALGIKDFTQMSLSNTFITFNSYEVVKQPWYSTFLGMVFIMIAVIVISVLISPASIGATSGLFGTNLAVGTGLGLTGNAAIIAGAITNAIAAVVISQVVSSVSTSIFGESWGAIVASIVNFAISFGIANGFGNLNLSNMMNPQTILGFASALANGYSGFVQAEIAGINEDMVDNQEEYDRAMRELDSLLRSMGLINDLIFDPLTLTNSVKGNRRGDTGSYLPETLDQFIGRTTMLGSDVVDMTLSMVSSYSDLQLTLPTD